MSQGEVLDFARQVLWTACLITMPMLLVSLVVGVAVSIFQAMTQIQEATLSFVPKIIAVVLALVFLGPWMLATLVNFTANLFRALPTMIR
jgi:flagellar biosynthetic protein FliQ